MARAYALCYLLAAAILPMRAIRFGRGGSDRATSELSEGFGPIASKLTTVLKELSGDPPAELQVRKLRDALIEIASALADAGLSPVAGQLTRNAQMLSACPDFGAGGTVEMCLQDEESKQTLQDKPKGKPAVLTDPSPSMGLVWSSRILGFIVEMFEKAVAGQRLHDAGTSSYNNRIHPAFAKCTVCADYALDRLVARSLTAGLRNENKFYTKVGGKDVAWSDMTEFANVARPLVDGIMSGIIAHRLDDARGY